MPLIPALRDALAILRKRASTPSSPASGTQSTMPSADHGAAPSADPSTGPRGVADRVASADYAQRMASEVARFRDQVDVHALPQIFHYWSNRYLRPILESFGYAHPEDFFEQVLAREYDRQGAGPTRPLRCISIGAGNCDAEVRIASGLVASGRPHFVLECLDLNPDMLGRGSELAAASGVAEQIQTHEADFNVWRPVRSYDLVMANQSLHHVVELEGLFDAIAEAIGCQGCFAASDMIGRNGHARWPEALEIVREFWRELPEGYRYNRQLDRHEPMFEDWDCSVEGFEGIRAQDILPLLVERFGFTEFIAWGNVIDPFIDRAFGHNFDHTAAWDRDFIDRVHARDEAEILAGRITPTHMIAVMVGDRSVQPRTWRHLTPQFCLRRPAAG